MINLGMLCTMTLIVLGLAGLLGYVLFIAGDLKAENERLKAASEKEDTPVV